jgi:hypothetical protein
MMNTHRKRDDFQFKSQMEAERIRMDLDNSLSRHFPDSLQIDVDHIQIAPPLQWFSLRRRRVA